MPHTIYLGCDHGGLSLKDQLVEGLTDLPLQDMGVHSSDSVDYPDIAQHVCEKVRNDPGSLGILICGTGIGMSIAANKMKGIRAALCSEPYSAQMAREHNDANVLCMGGRVLGPELAFLVARAFSCGTFAQGRHTRRLQKIDDLT